MARILIVDDDDMMRLVMKEHLSINYEVIDTGAPETALALALEYKPDAILLDLSMPGLSGFELCHALSSLSITQHIPIIIVSAEDARNKAFCLKLGASNCFTKPVDFPKLKAALEQVLNSKKDERRAHVRVQLKVTLKLRDVSKDGNNFAVHAVTEDMSKGGFLCTCDSPFEEGTTVEVTLCGERDLILGQARLVRILTGDGSDSRYGFQFVETQGTANLMSEFKSTKK